MNVTYRPPAGNTKNFQNYLKNIIQKNFEKPVYLVGDYNLNALHYSSNNKVKTFFDMLFQYGCLLLINKQTRVTMDEATAIDYIVANSVLTQNFETVILINQITFPFYTLYMRIFRIQKIIGIKSSITD